eukprot:scaffold29127_cov128-Isochrysis_galbana.AAC.3
MGDPAMYPEIRTARNIYALQRLPRDFTDDVQARKQWVDNNLTYLDGLVLANFHYHDADFRRDSWSLDCCARGSPPRTGENVAGRLNGRRTRPEKITDGVLENWVHWRGFGGGEASGRPYGDLRLSLRQQKGIPKGAAGQQLGPQGDAGIRV